MNTIGQPVSRVDSRLKVTGRVRYTADIPIEGLLHGAIVHSTIANGRTVSIDTTAAANAPGVVAVFTHSNMPRMNPTPRPWSHLHPHGQSYLPLQDDQIHYAGQPLALIVAHTLDQAIYAGRLINVNYEVYPAIVFGPDTAKDAVQPPQFLWPVASSVGDSEKGIATADVKIAAANLQQVQLNLQYTTIVAPVSGIVGQRSVQPGQNVSPGQQLMTIVPLDSPNIWVTANFKETQLTYMRPGQAVKISVDAYGRVYDGHVLNLAGASGARYSLLPPENATGNYVKVVQRLPVKIVLEKGQDPEHLLRPGMSVVPSVRVK